VRFDATYFPVDIIDKIDIHGWQNKGQTGLSFPIMVSNKITGLKRYYWSFGQTCESIMTFKNTDKGLTGPCQSASGIFNHGGGGTPEFNTQNNFRLYN